MFSLSEQASSETTIDSVVLEYFQQYVKLETQTPLIFVNDTNLSIYFDKLTGFLSANNIDYTIQFKENAKEKILSSVLVTREEVQSYLERKTAGNDFKSFLQVCYIEKKKRDLIAKGRTIASFKAAVERHIMNNIEGDFVVQLLPEDKSIVETYLNECHVPHTPTKLPNGLFKITIASKVICN